MKGKGAVERGTWMLSPAHPNCSPEVLGTTTTGTHPLLLLTLAAVSLPVLPLLLDAFFSSSCPVRVSGQSTCRHVGLGLSKAYYCPASIH